MYIPQVVSLRETIWKLAQVTVGQENTAAQAGEKGEGVEGGGGGGGGERGGGCGGGHTERATRDLGESSLSEMLYALQSRITITSGIRV
jgi:hypothetical protein